jgi:hypothetical protein
LYKENHQNKNNVKKEEKMMKRAIIFLILSGCFLFAADSLFIIEGWLVTDVSWFGKVRDSLHMNTLCSGSKIHEDSIKSYLNAAEDSSLNVILHSAFVQNGHRLDRYCDIWHSIWECEEDTVWFDHPEGEKVYDASASNDSAWACFVNTHNTGIMQQGRWGNYEEHISTRTFWNYGAEPQGYYDSLNYYAYFRLKIDDKSDTSLKVCSLYICNADYDPDYLFVDSILYVKDFGQENVYQTCTLTFSKKNKSNDLI